MKNFGGLSIKLLFFSFVIKFIALILIIKIFLEFEN